LFSPARLPIRTRREPIIIVIQLYPGVELIHGRSDVGNNLNLVISGDVVVLK
jgi:hypothetical protein